MSNSLVGQLIPQVTHTLVGMHRRWSLHRTYLGTKKGTLPQSLTQPNPTQCNPTSQRVGKSMGDSGTMSKP